MPVLTAGIIFIQGKLGPDLDLYGFDRHLLSWENKKMMPLCAEK